MLRLAVLVLTVALHGTVLATTTVVPATPRANGTVSTEKTSHQWSTAAPAQGPTTEDHGTPQQDTKPKWSTSAPVQGSSASYQTPSTVRPSGKQRGSTAGDQGGPASERPWSTRTPSDGPPADQRQTSSPGPAFRPSTAYAGGTTGPSRAAEQTTRGPFTTLKPSAAIRDGWKYRVLDGSGQTCILMSLHAILSVQYETVDNETRSVEVPVPEVEATGFCHETEARLGIAWSNFELRWTFEKNDENSTWNLTSVEADFKKSEAPFENALINDGGSVRLETEGRVQAPEGRAFHCPKNALSFSNSSDSQNVSLHIHSILVQAFTGGDSFAEADSCSELESQALTSGSPLQSTTYVSYTSRPPAYQTPTRNLPYQPPTLQPYVYKKVHSNMVKVYPPKKLMAGMYGDQSDPMGAMLWSWYMSGFYTGYYQALQQGKKF